jgi:hypothetical protein
MVQSEERFPTQVRCYSGVYDFVAELIAIGLRLMQFVDEYDPIAAAMLRHCLVG